MTLQSRFSTNSAVNFEFGITPDKEDIFINRGTLFVSLVSVNIATAPSNRVNVQIFIEDEQGKDLIGEIQARNKTSVLFEPNVLIPIPRDAKMIIEYPNPDNIEVSARVLWQL